MSDKVAVTLKVDAGVRAGLLVLARMDRRTMSSYVESLVDREVQEKKVDVNLIEEEKKKKASKGSEVLDVDLPGYIDAEVFGDWCDHLRDNHKTNTNKQSWVKYSMREFAKAHENGWDVNELMIEAITKGWKGCIFDKHKTTECEDVVSDKPHQYTKREGELMKLRSFEAFHNCSQKLFDQMVNAMDESGMEIDYDVIKRAFSRMCAKLNNNKERVNKVIERIIEDKYFVIDGEGCFEIMQGA